MMNNVFLKREETLQRHNTINSGLDEGIKWGLEVMNFIIWKSFFFSKYFLFYWRNIVLG